MTKLYKKRKLLLGITLLFVAISIIAHAVYIIKDHEFLSKVHDWIDADIKKNNYQITVDGKQVALEANWTKSLSIVSILIYAVFISLFYIFGAAYLFGKNENNRRKRWPYITMIAIGAALLIFKLSGIATAFSDHGTFGFTKELNDFLKDGAQDKAKKDWLANAAAQYSDFKSIIQVATLITSAISVILIIMNVVNLVYTIKYRNARDKEYSKEVTEFKPQKQNDLP